MTPYGVNRDKIKYSTNDLDWFLIYEIVKDESKLHKFLQIVSPETVLKKWKDIIKIEFPVHLFRRQVIFGVGLFCLDCINILKEKLLRSLFF